VALEDYVSDRVTRISRDAASLDGVRTAEAEAYGLRLSFADLLSRAVVKPEELVTLGHPDEASLNRVLYPDANRISNLRIVRGITLFQELRQSAFSPPEAATYDPAALEKSVVLPGAEVNRLVAQASLAEEAARANAAPGEAVGAKTASEETVVTNPTSTREAGGAVGDDSRALPLATVPARQDRLTDLQNARGMIKAQANFDLAFAETTGLAYVDDLRAAGVSTEEEVSYVLLPVYDKRTQGYDLQALAQRIHVYNRESGIVTDPFTHRTKPMIPSRTRTWWLPCTAGGDAAPAGTGHPDRLRGEQHRQPALGIAGRHGRWHCVRVSCVQAAGRGEGVCSNQRVPDHRALCHGGSRRHARHLRGTGLFHG
jgi:hypothetical protein